MIPVARALEADYDVIMPDSRGHGSSSAPEHGYSYDNLAADVLGFFDALNLSNAILVGHSMGGMTAAVAASLNPKRLCGVVLVDPPFLTPQRQREAYESDVVIQHQTILNRPQEDFLAEMLIKRSHRPRELMRV